eukprot:SAG31_NODE_45058_length_260_cov_0.770186_1_plen_54_part_01
MELPHATAYCAMAQVIAAIVICYIRPTLLCPCHRLTIGSLVDHAFSAIVGSTAL